MGPGIIPPLRPNTGGARWLRAVACAALAAIALVPAQAFAQSSPKRATGQTQAAILTPGSIAKTADMDFGTIAPPTAAGTVVLSAQATAVCTPTGALVRIGTCRAARFSIFGKKRNHVKIKDPSGATVILNGPSGATMSMDNMTIGVIGMSQIGAGGNNGNFGNWQIDTDDGITEFFVGGTLHVGATQTPGTYTGTLTIQILFN